MWDKYRYLHRLLPSAEWFPRIVGVPVAAECCCIPKLLPTFGHLSRFWRAYNFKSCQLWSAAVVSTAVAVAVFSCSADLCARSASVGAFHVIWRVIQVAKA